MKRLLINILLMAVSTIFALLIIELIFRFFIPQDLIIPMPAQEDEELIYSLSPNTKSYLKGTSVIWYHLETNSLGLRDTEHSFLKPPGTIRILLLGDSMSMGEGVELNETYIKQFEKIANDYCQNEYINTINAAIRGYGNDQELVLYQRIGQKFHSDFVILAFYAGNDFQDNRIGGIFKLQGENIIKTIPSEVKSQKYRYYSKQIKIQNFPGYRLLVGHSHLINYLRKGLTSMLTRSIIRKPSPEKKEEGIPPEDWNLTTSILSKWSSACRRNNSQPILLFIPTIQNINKIKAGRETQLRIDWRIKAFTSANNIGWINATGPLLRETDPNTLYLDDGHLNPKGHHIVAQELLHYFIEKRILTNGDTPLHKETSQSFYNHAYEKGKDQ